MRHRDWHQALDDLLEEVDKALKSKEKLAETDAPPIFASDGPEVGTKGQGQGEVASELATSDFSNFNTKDWSKAPMENVQVDPPEFSESNKRATRSMSSNSLLRQGAWEKRCHVWKYQVALLLQNATRFTHICYQKFTRFMRERYIRIDDN